MKEIRPNGLDTFSIVILNKALDTIWLIADISGKLEGLQTMKMRRGRKVSQEAHSSLDTATNWQLAWAVVGLAVWTPGSPS